MRIVTNSDEINRNSKIQYIYFSIQTLTRNGNWVWIHTYSFTLLKKIYKFECVCVEISRRRQRISDNRLVESWKMRESVCGTYLHLSLYVRLELQSEIIFNHKHTIYT